MEQVKPTTLNSVWAVAGDRIKPEESKIQTGWLVEIPLREYENWLTNRQDQAIAHFNQRGIAQWDGVTQYLGGKSYVQGSNGKIYKAIVDSVGANPVTSSGSWATAFISPDDPSSLRLFNGYIVTAADVNSVPNTRYFALTSITITLPSTATIGDNIVINKATAATVTIVPTVGTITTALGQADSVVYDIYDEINVTFDGSRWTTS